MDVTGDGSKARCCKEQYCIGTWNVGSINQGKLEVVKQEMNINILGISELKWMGMGESNSDDHYIYYCGQEPLRRNGVALIVNKRVCNAGNLHLIPGLGRSPGEGKGNPFQYSWLENPKDRGAWKATVHGVAKSNLANWKWSNRTGQE